MSLAILSDQPSCLLGEALLEVGLEMAMASELSASNCVVPGPLMTHQDPLQQVLRGSS